MTSWTKGTPRCFARVSPPDPVMAGMVLSYLRGIPTSIDEVTSLWPGYVQNLAELTKRAAAYYGVGNVEISGPNGGVGVTPDISLVTAALKAGRPVISLQQNGGIFTFGDHYIVLRGVTQDGMFPAIAVCDGIAMGHTGMKYSLVTRDLIADSTEAMINAHQFDAMVCIPNCDKNVPGLLMAAARLNIPTVFVSGGPMLPGKVHGKRTSLSSIFEAVGAYDAGKLDKQGLTDFEEYGCPTCGSCSGMVFPMAPAGKPIENAFDQDDMNSLD